MELACFDLIWYFEIMMILSLMKDVYELFGYLIRFVVLLFYPKAVLYVFLILDHGRRRIVRLAITSRPSMNWVIQQFREAMPFGTQPKYLFRDNDSIYGLGVKTFLKSSGIEEVRTAYRSPWQNPFVERVVGTLRKELLDHVIVLNQRHLEKLLTEFIEEYYYRARPHQGLSGEMPIPQAKGPIIIGPSKLISIPVLGGLHHHYQRVAA